MVGRERGNIFIVEDDEVLATRVLVPLARPFGEAILASTAAGAASAMDDRRGAPIALICDLRLPDGDGLEVIARARGRWPSVSALLVTGYGDAEIVNATFDLRVDLVHKPIESGRVRRFLLDACARAHAASLPARIHRVVQAWQHRYGLSAAEAEILERSALGEARESIATSRAVSHETIDKQVKSLLQKTGDERLASARDRVRQEAERSPKSCTELL